MSNQLIKETALGREQVFPKNYILNLKDKDSGTNLEDILKSFNMLFLPYLGNKPDTRKQVPMSLRHGGLWITYIVNNTVVTEWYDSTAIDDYTWGSDAYWREGSNMLVGDISISKQGTWVINGEDTGISPKGDKGDSPVIRICNNRILVSYDNGVTYEDLNNTPVFTLFRFNSNTNTHQVSYNLGLTWLDVLPDKVYYKFKYNESTNTYQVSTDFGKTWSNVSAEKVFYKFRFNPATNTHQVSTDLGNNWVDISSEKVFYKFRTNENKLLVSTNLGTTWEDCSELIAAWFRWVGGDTADSVGKILISRDELKSWTDLSPNITNNLRIKGYVATVGELPTSTAALGDIYMAGPTYDESDTTHNYPHYRMMVKQSNGWVDNGEYLSFLAGIVQELGDNSNVVMSLKAVTSKFSTINDILYPIVLSTTVDNPYINISNCVKDNTYKLVITIDGDISNYSLRVSLNREHGIAEDDVILLNELGIKNQTVEITFTYNGFSFLRVAYGDYYTTAIKHIKIISLSKTNIELLQTLIENIKEAEYIINTGKYIYIITDRNNKIIEGIENPEILRFPRINTQNTDMNILKDSRNIISSVSAGLTFGKSWYRDYKKSLSREFEIIDSQNDILQINDSNGLQLMRINSLGEFMFSVGFLLNNAKINYNERIYKVGIKDISGIKYLILNE